MKNTNFNKFLCILLCISMLIPCLPLTVGAAVEIPTEASLLKRIKYYYDYALRWSNFDTFTNYCAHYVNLQLQLIGINKGYVGGNGNDEYDNYKNLKYSAGGRKIHNYPATNATLREVLYDISSQRSVVTDVLVGFQWTKTTAGNKYGHSFLIHGIIGEYVYFSDSFSFSFNGKYYPEGKPIKWTIDQVVEYYGRDSHYTVEGIIWFEDEALTEALGGPTGGNNEGGDSGSAPPPQSGTDHDTDAGIGIYQISYYAGMHLRNGTGTNYTSLDVIPTGTEVYVTEIKGDWGRIFYEGKHGWTCLPGYTKRLGDLPNFVVDTYQGEKLTAQVGKKTLADALKVASDTSKYTYTITATADVKLTLDTSLGTGITLSLGDSSFDKGKYSFLLNGGAVHSNKSVKALAGDPLIHENVNDGTYIYIGQLIEMSFTSMRLVINDNVSMRFTAEVKGLENINDPEVVMIAVDESGIKSIYAPDSVSSGVYVFTTDGIAPEKISETLKIKICVKSNSFGAVGEVTGGEISCSPVDYVKAGYGTGERLDNLLEAMLNYGTEAQIYFDYNTSTPANSILPEDKRTTDTDSSVLVKANGVPLTKSDSTVHVSSARLVLLDNVAMRMLTSGDSGDSELSLLVWTEEEYLALCKKAEAAGKDISEYLVKGSQTYTLKDEEGAFTLDNIPVKKYADTYYFRLCQTDGNNVRYDYLFSYSVTTYCERQISDGKANEIDPLCMAIAQYSAAARDYFGYEING